MFYEDWSSKSRALLTALPILAAATSIAFNIVVLAFVIQLEAKIDDALVTIRDSSAPSLNSTPSDPFAVALKDMGSESHVNDSSEVDLMAGELFEVQVRNIALQVSGGRLLSLIGLPYMIFSYRKRSRMTYLRFMSS